MTDKQKNVTKRASRTDDTRIKFVWLVAFTAVQSFVSTNFSKLLRMCVIICVCVCTHARTLARARTHTHTHTLSLSLSLSFARARTSVSVLLITVKQLLDYREWQRGYVLRHLFFCVIFGISYWRLYWVSLELHFLCSTVEHSVS